MYIKLSDVKKHLNIDDYFTDDDAYLTALIEVAEDAVSQHLDIALDDLLVGGNNQFPPAIYQAMLLMIGNLYTNREPTAYTQVTKVPYTMEYLLGLYKRYYLP